MGRNRWYTGAGYRPVRHSTTRRYMVWAFCGRQSGAPAPFLVSWGLLAHVMACARTSKSSTRGVASVSSRNTRTLCLGASTAGTKSQKGGWTPCTMPLRNTSRERNVNAGARPYNSASRRLGSCSRSMWRILHRRIPSRTSGGQSPIITVIGRRCTITCGMRRGGGSWLRGCWWRQYQR